MTRKEIKERWISTIKSYRIIVGKNREKTRAKQILAICIWTNFSIEVQFEKILLTILLQENQVGDFDEFGTMNTYFNSYIEEKKGDFFRYLEEWYIQLASDNLEAQLTLAYEYFKYD